MTNITTSYWRSTTSTRFWGWEAVQSYDQSQQPSEMRPPISHRSSAISKGDAWTGREGSSLYNPHWSYKRGDPATILQGSRQDNTDNDIIRQHITLTTTILTTINTDIHTNKPDDYTIHQTYDTDNNQTNNDIQSYKSTKTRTTGRSTITTQPDNQRHWHTKTTI